MHSLELFPPAPALTAAEFEADDATIGRGRQAFVEVGQAILRIRDRGGAQLAAHDYRSFTDYMQRRWGWDRDYGYRLAQAAEVMQNLSADNCRQLPANEGQARELVGLSPEAQRATWATAVATSPDGKPALRDLRRLVQARAAEDRAERLAQPVPVPEPPPDFTYEPETTNLWHFRQCDPRFGGEHPGRCPGQVVVNVLHLWTQPGDLVVDPFAGSGTTLDVARAMGRRCLGFDLSTRRPDILPGDVTDPDWDQGPLPERVRLVFLDPPYWTQKRGAYTDQATDLSRVSLQDFLDYLEALARYSQYRLADDGVVALILSAARVQGVVYDLAFEAAKRFEYAGYHLIERVCVPYENAASQTGYWTVAAADRGFLLRAYRDLMIFAR